MLVVKLFVNEYNSLFKFDVLKISFKVQICVKQIISRMVFAVIIERDCTGK